MSNFTHFRKGSILCAILFISALGVAQVNQQWVARYNGPGNDVDAATSVAVDASGNVYVTGISKGVGTNIDYGTVKYNAAGVQQWVARYDGQENSNDRATSIAVDGLGNVYVTGASTVLIGSVASSTFVTIKYNSAGVEQWVAKYKAPGNGFDFTSALALDPLGNVYITGSTTGIGSSADFTTIKYNAAGVQQWLVRYNGPANGSDEAHDLVLDKDGNVYVTGMSTGISTNGDFTTIKYNSAGVQQWEARYNNVENSFERAAELTLDSGGNVYVTGVSDGDYATVKYDNNGNTKWVNRYNGSVDEYDEPFAIAADDKGNVFVTGISNMEGFFDPGDPSSAVYATIKYSTSGEMLWLATYDGPEKGYDRAWAIVLDASGNVYVTGESRGIGTGLDYATVKYNSNGVQQWVARYNGPGSSTDQASALAIDAQNNVYVTGSSYGGTLGTGTWFDYATIKYSQLSVVCGNNNDKVLVCHKGKKTICISEPDVADHIDHGDQLGECVVKEARIADNEGHFSMRNNELPNRFQVFIAPNPVSSFTKINYELPVDGHVSIKVYDMSGREITTLVNENRMAGYHSTEFNVSALQNGLYYCRVTVKTKSKVWAETKKINIVK